MSKVLKLAIRMQGATVGVCLRDIEQEFDVSRRTAERLRDGVDELFGPLVSRDDPSDQRRYWSLPAGRVTLLFPTAEELVHLASAAALLREQNRFDAATALDGIRAKLNRIDPDLDLLMQTEGLARRPGPRIKIDPSITAALRSAILANHKIRIHYRSRGTGGISWHKVCPYGFLYGAHAYLVAFSRNPNILDYRQYRLANIVGIESTDEPFERDENFSLDAFTAQSFGVFQEEPFDVVWRFSPDAAADAREYIFHPSQTLEDQPDGSLIVRFHAGGALEMSWHLYTWGDEVEVLEPADFWDKLE